MFVADGLVFIELQKTGGSHICRLLQQYANGHAVGKHHRLTEIDPQQFIMGSIRNPWDWYVSLWAFGVGGKGSIRMRTGRRFDIDYYRKGLPESMGKLYLSPGELVRSVYYDMVKPLAQWQQTYGDSSDPQAFRQWLRLLLDPQRAYDIGEGYAFSPLSQHAGLLTYRYFRLFTMGDAIFRGARLQTVDGLAEFDQQLNITDAVIRTESLESDFIAALAKADHALSESQCTSLQNNDAGKTNTSKRHQAAYYYDEESIRLVAEREAYLIGKYRYQPPED